MGGTSSGAAIVSDFMICRGRQQVEYGQGFALYPQAIVDSHFTGASGTGGCAGGASAAGPPRGRASTSGRRCWCRATIGSIGREGRGAYYHFADPAERQVRRYKLGAGEAIDVGVPVLRADQEVVEAAFRKRGEPDVLTAGWMAEEE